jgi:enterochelin esterase-like enzyme
MAIIRIEESNPEYAPPKTRLITVTSTCLGGKAIPGRGDVTIYNCNPAAPQTPIIILLHGVYGSHWAWMYSGGVHQVYERLREQEGLGEFVLVMPSDGLIGDGSGYLPTPLADYDRWIMEDVVEATRRSVDNVDKHSPVYLCGLSMGGYGCLRMGFKYATQVSAISVHSACTNKSDLEKFVGHGLSIYNCSDAEADILAWASRHRTQLPPFRFDCGESDALFEENLTLHKAMMQLEIPHSFEVFPGEHSWEYWHLQVADSLWFFHQLRS